MANALFCTYLMTSAGLMTAGLGDAQTLRYAGILVICMILAVGVHEFSHAFAAHRLGDPTPEGEGRLTLNPIAHMDPIGTLALPLILALQATGFFFGWGRPVNTNPRYYTRKVNMRAGMALVAFAGPLSNLIQAVITLLVVWGLVAGGVLQPSSLDATHPIVVFYTLNILLFAFNLLPLHPLDGGKVLAWILGPKNQHVDDWLVVNGKYIIIGLIVAPFLINVDLLGTVFRPFFTVGRMALEAVVL